MPTIQREVRLTWLPGRCYVLVLAGLIIAVGVCSFHGRWILRPVNRLIRSAEDIQKGTLNWSSGAILGMRYDGFPKHSMKWPQPFGRAAAAIRTNWLESNGQQSKLLAVCPMRWRL